MCVEVDLVLATILPGVVVVVIVTAGVCGARAKCRESSRVSPAVCPRVVCPVAKWCVLGTEVRRGVSPETGPRNRGAKWCVPGNEVRRGVSPEPRCEGVCPRKRGAKGCVPGTEVRRGVSPETGCEGGVSPGPGGKGVCPRDRVAKGCVPGTGWRRGVSPLLGCRNRVAVDTPLIRRAGLRVIVASRGRQPAGANTVCRAGAACPSAGGVRA